MTRAAVVLTVLALITPDAARAQQVVPASAELVRTISLSSSGTVRRAPDQAIVTLAVETRAATARQAAQQNAQRMDAVVRALRQAGIPGERIHTESYNLSPEYQYVNPGPGKPGEQRLVGYTASNSVRVQVDSIARVGATIDAAVGAGANRATGISFQLRDPDTARRDALRLAMDAARKDAQALAEAAGQTLGPLLQLSTGIVEPPRPMFAMARNADMAAPAAAPTPVEPGQLEITATVSVVYRLLAATPAPGAP